MKYYLETSALRALGKAINSNSEILTNSYTSMFSLYEIYREINRKDGTSSDSKKRSNILDNLLKLDLAFLRYMPNEMIHFGYAEEAILYDSIIMENGLSMHLLGEKSNDDLFDRMKKSYDDCQNAFSQVMCKTHSVKKGKKETISITSLNEYVVPYSEGEKNMQEVLPHPSRYIMDMIRDEMSTDMYFAFNKKEPEENICISKIYNGNLDIFFFVLFGYNLRMSARGGITKRNDLYDLFHALYLFDKEQVMVTNDNLLLEILPNINAVSVDDFRKLM